mmetsp:Transcript_75542/g.211753  ORF Transcript_75542/g.211753 Transcript_75542/m.211753 type:complete len:208 (-) Transcript_75542:556-1179(-)
MARASSSSIAPLAGAARKLRLWIMRLRLSFRRTSALRHGHALPHRNTSPRRLCPRIRRPLGPSRAGSPRGHRPGRQRRAPTPTRTVRPLPTSGRILHASVRRRCHLAEDAPSRPSPRRPWRPWPRARRSMRRRSPRGPSPRCPEGPRSARSPRPRLRASRPWRPHGPRRRRLRRRSSSAALAPRQRRRSPVALPTNRSPGCRSPCAA